MAVFEFVVEKVSGYCPVYSEGDKMVVDGVRLVLDNKTDLCKYALMTLKNKAASLVDSNGCDEKVKCMEKCAEFSTGGFVVFRCKPLEEAMV